jgi:phosphoglycolate phosphatase-like HAD superfamily hydrolase
MNQHSPTILALDFDGVVCDGLIEYFQTAWGTYCQIWSPASQTPESDLAPTFYRLRPVIETGWEMPVLIRALALGISEARIWTDWNAIAQTILTTENLQAADIGVKLDGLRDEWIATDLNGWLSLHRFYPGVVEKLKSLLYSAIQPYIITTKEGRFVEQLLGQQEIEMPSSFIYGKECQRPKHQILRELIAASKGEAIRIWFVEDRLKTLQSVAKQSDLDEVRLYLADWGYNTPVQHDSIRNHPRIGLLSLSQFAGDFSDWP